MNNTNGLLVETIPGLGVGMIQSVSIMQLVGGGQTSIFTLV